MAKFRIEPAPTFQATVPFPVPGGIPVDVVLTFRHRTKSQLAEFDKTRGDRTDVESFMALVTAWDLDEAYTAENVALLLENFMGVAVATYMTYIDELFRHKAKN